MATVTLDPSSVDDYRRFLAVKSLPHYSIRGRVATFPDEYADRVGLESHGSLADGNYTPPSWMFDYQRDIVTTAIQKRKYSLFVDCGFGKTAMFLEFANHVRARLPSRKRILIVSPLMVIRQTMEEASTFFPDMDVEPVDAKHLHGWMRGSGGIGITNYEAIRDDLEQGNLGCLILDESSMLKSHYGKWGTKLLQLGGGLNWKMAATGTPAPNDRIEYANHAVFMDAFPNVNSFLARYFVNRGQTQERWALKPHALEPFYRALSHWCIFMTNPSTYGWKDNATTIPPIHIHEHDVPLTEEQKQLAFAGSGRLFADRIGGITSRSVLSQIAKGSHKGVRIDTHKPGYIRDLIHSWPNESTIVWCRFNAEQTRLEEALPDAASITGSTPDAERQRIIYEFKQGAIKTLITKPKILGFGMNLQVATRQIFSACDDSYEEFYQAVKRSNRVGSTKPLHVHLPVTDIERMQMENVLRKAKMVQRDTDAQETMFKDSGYDSGLPWPRDKIETERDVI